MGRFIVKTVTNVIYHYILLYAIFMAYKRSVGDVMKKQNKKLLLGLAAIMLVSVCIFIFITQGFSGTHRWGGFQYENDKYYNNNTATITKAYYPKKQMVIPSTICFYKVRALGGYVSSRSLWGVDRTGMFENDKVVEEVIISEGIESIVDGCFNNAIALKSLEFPSTIKDISVTNCKNLTSVKFSENTVEIEDLSFQDCSSLEKIILPENIACDGISNDAFYNCTSLQEINIPDSVTRIKYWTFYNCVSLKQIDLSKNITEISKCAFSKCSGLEKIYIYEKCTSIADNAFDGCCKLTIYGIKGSYVEQYANEHNIPFEELDATIEFLNK